MVNATRLNGLNPLSYLGVNPYTPVPLFIQQRAPTINDSSNFLIGTLWMVTGHDIPAQIWMLVALEGGVATWVQIYPAGGGMGGASEFPCDIGTANEAGGILNVLGGQNIETTGSGNTVTVATTDDIHVPATLTVVGNATFDDDVTISDFTAGVVQSDSVGLLSSTKGGNGQLLIGGAGIPPSWQNISSLDSSVTITNGANSIDLSVTQGGEGRDAFMAHQLNSQEYHPYAGGLSYPPYFMGCGNSVHSGEALTILYSNSGAFYAGDGISLPAKFTAPANGLYYLQFTVWMLQGTSSTFNGMDWFIETTSNTYNVTQPAFQPGAVNSSANFTANISVLAPMNSGDTATFQMLWTVPTSQYITIAGASSVFAGGDIVTYVMGFRVA